MIRLIVRFGSWLDKRFPQKMVVTVQAYSQLQDRISAQTEELSMLRSRLNDNALSLNKALERLSVVESNAVHKGAVSDLILSVKSMKDDFTSFKASMGFRQNPVANAEIEAMLNGEVL